MQQQDQPSTVSFCPSFSSYSSDHLSSTAHRVTQEQLTHNVDPTNHNQQHHDDDDDDFEFVFVRTNPHDCSAVGDGDEMCASHPVFPVFNRDLLLEYENEDESKDQESEIRLPLGKLFIGDQDPLSSSSSSSEADELEGIKPATYCVWTRAKSPSNNSPSPSRCKKSNSTGSSSSKPKWRLRDLLHLRRSNSDGKASLIYFNSDQSKNISNEINLEKTTKPKTTSLKAGKAKEKVSAHEVFYVRNKALKEEDKRRSYLPYRQGLVGFFSNVNGLGRSFPPF
ncbi:hypothetical protein M5689_003172 [Euphorbia peplus]|nr:hypothetical protein M5689_003172 [Euphorbia peplus]